MGIHKVKPSRKFFRQLLKHLQSNGCNISEACDTFKISRQTFYNYMEKPGYEFMRESLEEADTRSTEHVKTALYKNCLEGNVTAQIYWLNNKSDGEFTNRQYIEHSGSIEEKISKMTPDERETRINELLEKAKK